MAIIVVVAAEVVEEVSSTPFHFVTSPSGWATVMDQDVHEDLVLTTVTPKVVGSSPPGTAANAMSGCAILETRQETVSYSGTHVGMCELT